MYKFILSNLFLNDIDCKETVPHTHLTLHTDKVFLFHPHHIMVVVVVVAAVVVCLVITILAIACQSSTVSLHLFWVEQVFLSMMLLLLFVVVTQKVFLKHQTEIGTLDF